MGFLKGLQIRASPEQFQQEPYIETCGFVRIEACGFIGSQTLGRGERGLNLLGVSWSCNKNK
jgi:hypothetical protein